eukprot:2072540-Amphidinium_carterae.1
MAPKIVVLKKPAVMKKPVAIKKPSAVTIFPITPKKGKQLMFRRPRGRKTTVEYSHRDENYVQRRNVS